MPFLPDPAHERFARVAAVAAGVHGLPWVSRGCAYSEVARLDPGLATLWRASAPEPDGLAAMPEQGGPSPLLAAWCADRLLEVRARDAHDVAAAIDLGRVISIVVDAYFHGGWAVMAGLVACAESRVPIRGWPTLVVEVGARRIAIVRDEARAQLMLCADAGAWARGLAAIGADAPGGTLVTEAIVSAVDAAGGFAGDPVWAPFRLAAGLDRGAAWLGGARDAQAGTIGETPIDLVPLVRAVLETPWTWAAVDRWLDGDPLAPAKAAARVAGAARWVTALEGARAVIASSLPALLRAAWRTAATAPIAAPAATRAPPLVAALGRLADAAAQRAAAELGATVRSADDRDEVIAKVERVLGNPAGCAALWQPESLQVVVAAEAAR